MAKKARASYYAVRVGRNRGIFSNWEKAKEQVHKFKKASFKGFGTMKDAEAFMNCKRGSMQLDVPVPMPVVHVSQPSQTPWPNSMPQKTKSDNLLPIEVSAVFRDGNTGFASYFGSHDVRNSLGTLNGNRLVSGHLVAIWKTLCTLNRDSPKEHASKRIIMGPSRYVLNCIGPWADIWETNSYTTLWGGPVIEARIIKKIREQLALLKGKGIHVNFAKSVFQDTEGNPAYDLAAEGADGRGIKIKNDDTYDANVSNEFTATYLPNGHPQLVYVTGVGQTIAVPNQSLESGYGVFFNDFRDVCGTISNSNPLSAEFGGVDQALEQILMDDTNCSDYLFLLTHSQCTRCLNYDDTTPSDKVSQDLVDTAREHEQVLYRIFLSVERLKERGIEILFQTYDPQLDIVGTKMAQGFALAALDGSEECMYYGDQYDVVDC